MSTGLLDITKRAALDAVENAKLTDLRYGTVVSASPLSVRLTEQFVLPASLLVVAKHLTDYDVEIDITANWETDSGGEHTHTFEGNTDKAGTMLDGGSIDQSDPFNYEEHTHTYGGTTETADGHIHNISGKKRSKITVYNALKVGDKVALLRQAGGQSYFIVDRY